MGFSEMSNEALIEEYKGYVQQIETIGCYGTKDLMARDIVQSELEKRGYEIWFEPQFRLSCEKETEIEVLTSALNLLFPSKKKGFIKSWKAKGGWVLENIYIEKMTNEELTTKYSELRDKLEKGSDNPKQDLYELEEVIRELTTREG